MTKAKTFVVLLAVVGLCAGSALGQATKTTIFQVDYGLGPTAHDNTAGRDNSIIGAPGESHSNQGAHSGPRIMKGFQHTYIADWDTAPMMADVDVGGQLVTGWGSYTPNYYMAIQPRTDISYWNDNGTPADPLDDFVNPITGWPDPGTPGIVNISSVWSTNDWYEGDGSANFLEYNWTNPMGTWASTIWNAGDHPVPGAEIPWSFPGGGDDGTGNPWPPFPNCTFYETFHSLSDYNDFDPTWPDPVHGAGWGLPSNGQAKTPTNSTPYVLDSSPFYHDDGGTPADPSDDRWLSPYVEVPLDQAMMDDMFNNVNNRGVALWEWDHWSNAAIYGADQNPASWPYIYARIEACSGDANLDQVVDGLDYVSWSNNYNLPATWPTGDFNGDGVADGLDYVVWSNNYQQSCPDAPGAVPEPATMALLAIGGLALLKRRR